MQAGVHFQTAKRRQNDSLLRTPQDPALVSLPFFVTPQSSCLFFFFLLGHNVNHAVFLLNKSRIGCVARAYPPPSWAFQPTHI